MTVEDYREALKDALPPPILELAVRSYNSDRRTVYGSKPSYLISDGFWWDRTPERYVFWNNVHSALYHGNVNFPPLKG